MTFCISQISPWTLGSFAFALQSNFCVPNLISIHSSPSSKPGSGLRPSTPRKPSWNPVSRRSRSPCDPASSPNRSPDRRSEGPPIAAQEEPGLHGPGHDRRVRCARVFQNFRGVTLSSSAASPCPGQTPTLRSPRSRAHMFLSNDAVPITLRSSSRKSFPIRGQSVAGTLIRNHSSPPTGVRVFPALNAGLICRLSNVVNALRR
jgi:hypothetical protein